MWVSFKSEVIAAIVRFIPSKMTKTKYSLPRIDSYKKTQRDRAHVQKVIRDAYWKHVSIFFSFGTDTADPDCPRKNEEKLLSPSRKTRAFGITTLIENGILKTDTLDKANICNKQFQSAFIRESLLKAQALSPPWLRSQLTQKGSLNC